MVVGAFFSWKGFFVARVEAWVGGYGARCRAVVAAVAVLGLGACAQAVKPSPAPAPSAAVPKSVLPAVEALWAVTATGDLMRFKADRPEFIEFRQALSGLPAGDMLIGIDYRVAKGVMFAVARSGRVFTVNTATASLSPVGQPPQPLAVALRGARFGVDFNPAADRIRVVSDTGQNLRLHPDTGAVIDFDAQAPATQADPDLRYATGDVAAGQAPQLVSAAYTYNTKDEKVTTNFALDAAQGTLVTQGSREGVLPAESPNLGVLHTVGRLGTGPLLDAGFDISDVRNTALAVIRTPTAPQTGLYRIDLNTGVALRVGTVGNGQALVGLAIEP